MRSVVANGCLVLLSLALVGCGSGETALRGSLGQDVDLSYTKAVLELDLESCALRFLRPRGTGEDLVLKIGVTLTGVTLAANGTINLAERMPSGGQRAIVTRNVFDDQNKKLPAMERGELKLLDTPVEKNPVRGELSMTFVSGYEFGTGRTVYGTFTALVGTP